MVSHDNRLKRLAGVNKTIRNLTLKEVEHLTSHQGHFSGRFVSFDTFYQKAKKLNMPLLIELKPIGTEPGNYVDLFLETYHRLGISKDNKVMSLDLEVIEAIKKKIHQLRLVISYQFNLAFLEMNLLISMSLKTFLIGLICRPKLLE